MRWRTLAAYWCPCLHLPPSHSGSRTLLCVLRSSLRRLRCPFYSQTSWPSATGDAVYRLEAHVFDTPARREAYHLLHGVRAYADGRGAVASRALAAPFVLTAVVPAPVPPPPTPEEQLIDLSQALSLEDHVTTPDSDDETILEEDNRAPSPTKRDRAASEDFWDADHVPREWVAPPKKPAKRARAVYRCRKCGQPKRGHVCPFA